MPWSEWQTGPTAIASFQKYAIGWLNYGGGLTNGWYTVPTKAIELYASALDLGVSDNPYGTVEHVEGAVYYVIGDQWKTDRDWFPVTLLGLEEGVDYGLRPGRTEFDDDAYVEYESDGDNTVTEEFKPLLRYTAGSVGGGEGAIHDGDGVWALSYVANPPLPVQESDGAEFSVETWPSGTVFATGGVEPTNTSHSSSFPAGFSTASAIHVTATMPGTPPLVGESASAESAQFTIGSPSFRYQMPRWRYWIPRDLPLRQRQRDDGLALRGAPSWRRGTSRQATNRWRSYL